MGLQLGRRLLVISLFVLSSLFLSRPGLAQRSTGSLAGTLTDTRSAPLEYVTVTLRSVSTGASVTAVTSRGGKYSFHNLPDGEYTLAATGEKGTGEVGGIMVLPGHVARVQAAIDFGISVAAKAEVETAAREIASENAVLESRKQEFLAHPITQSELAPQRAALEASFPLVSLAQAPLSGHARNVVAGGPIFVSTIPVLNASVFAALKPMALVALPDALLTSRNRLKLELSAARFEPEDSGSDTLDDAQLGSLPRDFENIVGDTRLPDHDSDEGPSPAEHATQELHVDDLQVGSAFGLLHREQGRRSDAGESAITLLHRTGPDSLNIAQRSHESISIETRRGTDRLHGQMSLFDRQRLLAAQNPFTQWTKLSAPSSAAIVPAFTSAPYTPADIDLRWGAAVGGALRGHRQFWFGSLDGNRRSDPVMSAVRHPERFFAQPTNDQIRLLSAQLGLGGADPTSDAVAAYSKLLESLAGLLGPAPRSSLQLSGFGRLDWSVREKYQFTVEANASRRDAPGGGFTRAWQAFGNHSLGSAHLSNEWLLARWSTAVTPQLVSVTQGSIGRHLESSEPESPSLFEQSLNIGAWGQLPQIVVDSRDGFTIGNPARFGRGRYPDETLYSIQQQIKWMRHLLALNVGGEFIHEVDATSRLLNQTGTYHYASIGDFASDALAFFAFGLNGQLNSMDPHNCDQRGKPWRDAAGVLHGLGHLPCYSYYSQTMGPSEWWLSTNDWASYASSQWRPTKAMVFTIGARWEMEQLPPPIDKLNNPDLPQTQRLPSLGSQWGPRAGFALGTGGSHWPVLRLGYGMYFSRTPNARIETALTQTGSRNGDLSYFMRPTDSLRAAVAPPFPYVLSGDPGTGAKPGAVEFSPSFHNGGAHQAALSLEETLPGRVHLEASAVAGLGRKLPVTVDSNIDPAMNPKTITYTIVDGNGSGPIKTPQITVPFFASWPSAGPTSGLGGRLNPNYQRVSEIFSRANSSYQALVVRLSRNGRGLAFRGRYTFGHATDWNPDESSQISRPSVLDPRDFRQEYGISDLDVRHLITTSVVLQPKLRVREALGAVTNGWMMSAIGHFASGSPFTMRTSGSVAKEFNVSGQAIVGLSTGMNGYGGDNRIYGVGRNTYRYPSTWKADLRLSKRFDLDPMRQLELIAESFNMFNHQNVTQLETIGYSIEPGTLNGAMPRLNFLTGLKSGQPEFGKPLDINATDLYHQRQFQFGARLRF